MGNTPIVITGCARSGTSLTAGVFHICGAFGGEMFGANKNNQKGFFENQVIREQMVKPFLRGMGVDHLGQKPLPTDEHLSMISQERANLWRKSIFETLERQGYKDGPWFYKGAKSCLYWPLWHMAFPEAKWVVVRRPTEKIVASCLRTSFMKAYRDEKGWTGWVNEHIRRFEEMKAKGLNISEIHTEKIIDHSYIEVKKVIDELGLTWNYKKINQFVSPELWEQGKKVING